jgi:hypothetical protein
LQFPRQREEEKVGKIDRNRQRKRSTALQRLQY